jgi:hypothetical protein
VSAAGSPVGASVLCPGFVQTDLWRTSIEVVPAGAEAPPADTVARGSSPPLSMAEFVRLTLDGIEQDRLHILTHPEGAAPVHQRVERLLRDVDSLVGPATGG